jgi:hypothetical protein
MPYPARVDVEKFRATFIPTRRFVSSPTETCIKRKKCFVRTRTMATEDMKNKRNALNGSDLSGDSSMLIKPTKI